MLVIPKLAFKVCSIMLAFNSMYSKSSEICGVACQRFIAYYCMSLDIGKDIVVSLEDRLPLDFSACHQVVFQDSQLQPPRHHCSYLYLADRK